MGARKRYYRKSLSENSSMIFLTAIEIISEKRWFPRLRRLPASKGEINPTNPKGRVRFPPTAPKGKLIVSRAYHNYGSF